MSGGRSPGVSGWRRRAQVAVERVRQPLRRLALRDSDSERRFWEVAPRYTAIVATVSDAVAVRSKSGSSYDWSAWAQEVYDAFRGGVPETFLRHRRIRGTMVYEEVSSLPERLAMVLDAFGPEHAHRLLREDAIGTPDIVETTFLTSANRAHHASHLASYAARVSRAPWACSSFLEWGGGYGNMARIIRRLAPRATYTILDLPPILALQYVYLASLEGEEACRIVTASAPAITEGKINFVDSSLVTRGIVKPTAEMFLSTWAASESPPAAQEFIAEHRFFGAPRLLLAYLEDENNRLLEAVANAGCTRHLVSALEHDGFGGQHAYAFR